MNILLAYVTGRLMEPSTYIGAGALVTAIVHKDPSSAFLALGGILGIVLPEGKSR